MLKSLKEALFSKDMSWYRDEVLQRNHQSFDAFALVGVGIALLVLIYGLIMDHVVTFNTEFFLIFSYFALMFLVSRLFLKRHRRFATAAFYIALTPLMIIAILMGTFFDPEQPSITIMVFLCVLPIFLLDKPWRVVTYITVVALVYTVCCYLAKDYYMFVSDMIDLIAFYFLAVGVNCFSLHDRISSVENYVRFREKSEVDLLTGLYNRGTGVERIESLLEQRIAGSLIILDIDNFKNINDSFGHLVGDELLRQTARVLTDFFSGGDILLRLGGDEFAVYAVGLADRTACEARFDALLAAFKAIHIAPLNGQPLGFSLGCALALPGSTDFEPLYKYADACLYRAKNLGKSRYVIGDGVHCTK